VALSRRNGRSRATLVFLVLTSITVITLDFRGEGSNLVEHVRDTAADVLAPVRDATGAVLQPIGDAFSGVTRYSRAKDQIADLREQLDAAKGDAASGRDARAELQDLLAQQHLTWVGDLPRVTARVVSAPVSNFEQTIELDRGTDDGVRADMPVVTEAGLVGRVVQASGKRAMVRLVTDPSASVGVRFATSSEVGIADGSGAARALDVGFVAVESSVAKGEIAVTSGFESGSDLYPAGIPVGIVSKSTRPEGELQADIELTPLADLRHLRHVQVLQVAPVKR
jgi:rod shape-determining protein MreC